MSSQSGETAASAASAQETSAALLKPIVSCVASLVSAARDRAVRPFDVKRRRAFAVRGVVASPALHERANVRALTGVPTAVQNVLTRIAVQPSQELVATGSPLQDALHAIVTTDQFADWRAPVVALVSALEDEMGLLLVTIYVVPDLCAPRERTSLVCVFQLASRPVGCSFDHEMYALTVLVSVPGGREDSGPLCVICTRYDDEDGDGGKKQHRDPDPDDPTLALPVWSGQAVPGRVDIDAMMWLPSSAYMAATPTARVARDTFLISPQQPARTAAAAGTGRRHQ